MPPTSPIYLDYAATTPVDERVLQTMWPYFAGDFGNPASVHEFGRRAEKALEDARQTVATILNCAPYEIIFTSCGTEADNLALRGAALAARAARGARHIITTPIEHGAVLSTARHLHEHFDFDLTLLPVDEFGRVNPDDVGRALRPDTALVSVVYANNEIGTIQPLAEIAAVCQAQGVPLHTDAVQAASQLPVDVQALGVDYLALGAHKFYGPKGIGVLYARHGQPLLPMQTGGGHEDGRRAGTQNIPYIVALATALKITTEERATHNARFQTLRDRLIAGLLGAIPQSRLTGHPTARLPNHTSFVFEGVDGNELLMHLDLAGIAASSGSACKTGDPEPSEVLLALGLAPELALGSLRVTVGRPTTDAEVAQALQVIPATVAKLRQL